MAVISDGIRGEKNGAISFGDYKIEKKLKVAGFELNGDLYSVKTHSQITRLEKNDKLLAEAVPGATFHNLLAGEKKVTFAAEGFAATQITLELEPGAEYKLFIDGVTVDKMKANMSGKINFSAELTGDPKDIRIEKA